MSIGKLCILPYSVCIAFWSLFNYNYKPNGVFNRYDRKLTGNKKVAFSKALSTEQYFDKAKKHKVSINDLILTSANIALAQFTKTKDC